MKRTFAWLVAIVLAYALVVAGIGVTARARPSDLIVVFGNQVAKDGTPSPRLAARLATAAALYRARTAPTVFVSGGLGREGFDEATVMHDDLVRRGVPDSAIVVDKDGRNSALTCTHAAAWLPARGPRRVVLVTQWFHVGRAYVAAHNAGLGTVSAQAPRWVEARDAYSFARELVALPVYALRRRAASTVPEPGV